MKIKTQKLKICNNCLNKVPMQQRLSTWAGYKVRDGHVFCKTCSTQIK